MLQGTVIPAFEVERRICHNVIEVQSLVQIVQKAGITGFAKVMADAAQGKVHFGKAIGRRLFFLSIHIDTVNITLFGFYECRTLDKHTAGTAARVIKRAVIRLNHRCDKLNGIMRRIELALLLGGIDREFFQKVFVYATDQVFFLAKLLVADLVDFIDQLFDVVCGKVACGKGALHKASFQLFRACRNAVKCIVQCYIQLGCRRIDDGRPSCLRRQIVGAIRKGGIVKERRTNVFIIRIKPLFN